jgi:DNA topoisomerase-1
VKKTSDTAERQSGERMLGVDPATGKNVYVKVGRYGPFAQLGEGTEDEKPKYGKLRTGQMVESITLDEAIELFKLPRVVGEFEGKEMKASVGRFGPYIAHDGKFYSIPKPEDAYTVDAARAVTIIEEKRVVEANKLIKAFPEDENLRLLNGRWGPYIGYGKNNFKIPKGTNVEELTFEQAMKIVGPIKPDAPAKKTPAKRTAAKKGTAKKAAPKKAAKNTAAKKTAANKAKT